MIKVSVIVPVHNESESIEDLFLRTQRVLDSLGGPWEFIVVDDCSNDDTRERMERIAAGHTEVLLLLLLLQERRMGKSFALARGFAAARGEIAVTLDGDLQDLPEEIPALVAAIEGGLDLVSGWRRHRRDHPVKRFVSFLFNAVVNLFGASNLHDNNCGLKAYRRRVYQRMNIWGGLHRLTPVIARRMGFRIGEVEIRHEPRKYGLSRYHLVRISGAWDLLTVLLCDAECPQPKRDYLRAAWALGTATALCLIVIVALALLNPDLFPFALAPVPLALIGCWSVFQLLKLAREQQALHELTNALIEKDGARAR